MVQITGEIMIKRPVEDVFDLVADARNEPRYNPIILRSEQLTDGPIGVGTRFRDESRSLGRRIQIFIEHTTYERPHRLTSAIQMAGANIDGTLTFDPVAKGTRMRWCWEVESKGVFKLLSPLVGRLGRRQEERTWAGLKRYLEGQEVTP